MVQQLYEMFADVHHFPRFKRMLAGDQLTDAQLEALERRMATNQRMKVQKFLIGSFLRLGIRVRIFTDIVTLGLLLFTLFIAPRLTSALWQGLLVSLGVSLIVTFVLALPLLQGWRSPTWMRYLRRKFLPMLDSAMSWVVFGFVIFGLTPITLLLFLVAIVLKAQG